MASDLANLESSYTISAKKYKLPTFKTLVADFEIDKIDRPTLTPLRLIRKVIMEKIVNTITFLEMISNPVNSPKVYLPFIKNISTEDKKLIDEIYNSLGVLSVASLELEVDYNEKREAEMVKEAARVWNSAKPKLSTILSHIKKPVNDTSNNPKREKSYFG